MTKEFKLSILLIIGVFGSILLIGFLYPIFVDFQGDSEFILNLIFTAPYLFAFIFPIIFLKEKGEDTYLLALSIILIAYTAIQLMIVVADGYSVNNLSLNWYGYLGFLVMISIIVIAIISFLNFNIPKGLMISLIVYSVLMLLHNPAVMDYIYQMTLYNQKLNSFITIISSGMFQFKEIAILIGQIIVIDQLLNK